ncbi:tRNA pseudouridine synthase A [Lachnospiraceae bacterium KM106-2]|nr:tRNA pseudouridine synthase A [Lachnospiraceae bacterium KM106-2]
MCEKRNIKIIIAYDGAAYNGWQRLGNNDTKRTVQGTIELALKQCLNEKVDLVASGRTDAGVHALGQVANFYMTNSMLLPEIKCKLNEILPADIRILTISEVPLKFHSRYDAVSKEYEYHIDLRSKPDVFTRAYFLSFTEKLNIKSMKEAASYMLGKHDFAGFSSKMRDDRSTVRTIESITITQEEDKLFIRVKGDGFLYNMVRIIVGTLLEAGTGVRTPESVLEILRTKDRQLAGYTVNSHGLMLRHVWYPLDVLADKGSNC